MKKILLTCLMVCLFSATLMAEGNEVQCKFKPHFQANLDLKVLGTGHLIHSGDFKVVKPYVCEFNLDMPAGGPGIDAVIGCRVRDFFFIGGGVSLEWWVNANSNKDWSFEPNLPGSGAENLDMSRYGMGWAFYAAPRFYIPVKKAKDITPYFDLGIGFCQFIMMLYDHGVNQYVMDLYAHGGVGVDIKRFNISAGYQYSYNSNGYLRIGYRF